MPVTAGEARSPANTALHGTAAVNGTAAGGYEFALACDQIVLIDDGSPEVLRLGVLCGTGGSETMEAKVFGRLTAWQNWIFTRPNASGPDGALRRFGTGRKGDYDYRRV
jgi:hypothetical protein